MRYQNAAELLPAELLEALPPSAALYQGSGTQIWEEITPAQAARGGAPRGPPPGGGNGPRRKAGQGQGEGETAGQQAGQYASFHQFAAPFYVDVGTAMSRPN